MQKTTTILTAIQYPLTEQSVRTLEHAADIASAESKAELLVLHVNLFQNDTRAKRAEISRAIRPIIGEVEAALMIRSGFLIEEAIADEAVQTGANHIVISENRKPTWRRLLSRVFRNDPAVSAYLREHTDATVEVIT